MRARLRALSAVLILPVVGCATARNYLEPDRPVYESAFGVGDGARETPDVIRVVTFNLQRGEHVRESIDVLRSRPALAGADLLLLQEMQAPGVEEIARALHLNAVYYPASHHTREDRDIGNAVLSPWPIEGHWKVLLPHLSRFSHHARVAVAARLRIGARRLRAYSLHIGTPFNLSGGQRREQLGAVVADARDSPDPVLIAGDFNSKGMAEWLSAQGFDWPTRDVGKTTTTLLSFSFDHVLVRRLESAGDPGAGVARGMSGISDHDPVWVKLRFDRNPEP